MRANRLVLVGLGILAGCTTPQQASLSGTFAAPVSSGHQGNAMLGVTTVMVSGGQIATSFGGWVPHGVDQVEVAEYASVPLDLTDTAGRRTGSTTFATRVDGFVWLSPQPSTGCMPPPQPITGLERRSGQWIDRDVEGVLIGATITLNCRGYYGHDMVCPDLRERPNEASTPAR